LILLFGMVNGKKDDACALYMLSSVYDWVK
jgi:hypothetical protein